MNKKIKKLIALGLCATMVVSMAACGSKKDKKEKEAAGEKVEKEQLVAAEAYQLSYGTMPMEDEAYISNYWEINGRIYYTYETYEMDDDGMYTDSFTKLMSVDPTNTSDNVTVIDFGSTWAENSYTQISGISINKDESISLIYSEYHYAEWVDNESVFWENNLSRDDEPTEENIAIIGVDLKEMGLDMDDISGMTLGEVYDMWLDFTQEPSEDDGDDEEYQIFRIDNYDKDGNFVNSIDITDKVDPEIGFGYRSISKEGVIYSCAAKYNWDEATGNDSTEAYIIKTDTVTGDVTFKQISTISDFQNVTKTANGDIIVAAYDNDYNTKFYILDEEKNELVGDGFEPNNKSWVDCAGKGPADSIYYTSNNNLYMIDAKTGEGGKVLDFVDCGVDGDYPQIISDLGDGKILIVTNEWIESGEASHQNILFNILTPCKASDIAKKTEIVLISLYEDYELEDVVKSFNKTSTDKKIVIKAYYDYDTEFEEVDDYTKYYNECLAKFMLDVKTGEGYDLVNLSYVSDYKDIDVLDDLNTYISKDSELSGINFNQSVLGLFGKDGKQFALPARFTLNGLASRKSTLNGEPLTIDKLTELIKNNPDKQMYENLTRDTFVRTVLGNSADYFYDRAALTCNFDDGQFAKVLEIAKDYPTESEKWDNYDENAPSEAKLCSEGKMLFLGNYVSSPREYTLPRVIFGEDFVMTGFPSVKGEAASVNVAGVSLGINSKSKYKDDCFGVIKDVYLKSVNDEWGWGFPVDNDKLDEMIEANLEENLGEDDHWSWGWNDIEVELGGLTAEEAVELKELLNSECSLSGESDQDIYEIIMEEAEAFFSGSKSASDVCDIIQSRVNIYINEKG